MRFQKRENVLEKNKIKKKKNKRKITGKNFLTSAC